MEPAAASRLLRLVAVEASEEPDTIARRPEVIDLLEELARDDQITSTLERVTQGRVDNPAAYFRAVAQALRPYRDAPFDDAPQLVEAVGFLGWVVGRVADDQPTAETPAVALV
jgi:hypothetical protein